jgi:hypothetical protein
MSSSLLVSRRVLQSWKPVRFQFATGVIDGNEHTRLCGSNYTVPLPQLVESSVNYTLTHTRVYAYA